MKILLADDHTLIREALRTLLEMQPGFSVIGEAANGRDAVAAVSALEPDLVLMDIDMPGMNGIEATRQVASLGGGPRVIGLSMHMDRHFAFEMLQAGALGYLFKGCPFAELLEAIRTVSAGRRYLPAAIAESMLEDYLGAAGGPSTSEPVSLSAREREVLQLIAEGLGNKQIAATLGIAVNTVDTHKKHIGEKLNLRSVAELTKYAIARGMTSLR